MNIKWIFFDIGSTLIDEEKAYNHRIIDMIAGTDLYLAEVFDKRVDFFKCGLDGNSEIIKHFGLTKTPWHSEDEKPYPDTSDVLLYLRNRGYNLGIIANQAPGLSARLSKWNIAKHFDIIASSSKLGVSKPNPIIFQAALSKAKCYPSQAVMVGDRLDNDIIPAKSCCMKTIWFRSTFSSNTPKAFAKDYADYIIDSLSQLKEIF